MGHILYGLFSLTTGTMKWIIATMLALIPFLTHAGEWTLFGVDDDGDKRYYSLNGTKIINNEARIKELVVHGEKNRKLVHRDQTISVLVFDCVNTKMALADEKGRIFVKSFPLNQDSDRYAYTKILREACARM